MGEQRRFDREQQTHKEQLQDAQCTISDLQAKVKAADEAAGNRVSQATCDKDALEEAIRDIDAFAQQCEALQARLAASDRELQTARRKLEEAQRRLDEVEADAEQREEADERMRQRVERLREETHVAERQLQDAQVREVHELVFVLPQT